MRKPKLHWEATARGPSQQPAPTASWEQGHSPPRSAPAPQPAKGTDPAGELPSQPSGPPRRQSLSYNQDSQRDGLRSEGGGPSPTHTADRTLHSSAPRHLGHTCPGPAAELGAAAHRETGSARLHPHKVPGSLGTQSTNEWERAHGVLRGDNRRRGGEEPGGPSEEVCGHHPTRLRPQGGHALHPTAKGPLRTVQNTRQAQSLSRPGTPLVRARTTARGSTTGLHHLLVVLTPLQQRRRPGS